jgi:hypothetical protein
MANPDDSQSILGKKIFFLYPSAPIQNQVIFELVKQEYEVYTSRDHTRLSHSLKKYHDSIIYVNIEEKMPEPEWEKWIISVRSSHPDIQIGVFSSKNVDELIEKYTKKLKVSCGFLHLKFDMSKAVEAILETLKEKDVKGRRKYLRASTEREGNTTLNMSVRGGDFINGLVRDISVVGISCTFDEDPKLAKNMLLKDIQIKLQSTLIKVEAVVFGSRMDGEQKVYVMLFTQIDMEVKNKIRKFIQNNLQSKMDNEIN